MAKSVIFRSSECPSKIIGYFVLSSRFKKQYLDLNCLTKEYFKIDLLWKNENT